MHRLYFLALLITLGLSACATTDGERYDYGLPPGVTIPIYPNQTEYGIPRRDIDHYVCKDTRVRPICRSDSRLGPLDCLCPQRGGI